MLEYMLEHIKYKWWPVRDTMFAILLDHIASDVRIRLRL